MSSDDGFRVLDRNGNGSIDNGRELFGDSTPLPNEPAAEDGFAALAAEDTNGDGAVTAADARFSQLRVWRDLNQDGVSGANELFTLSQLGIAAINVASVARDQVLGNGNRIADVGTFVRSDGTEGAVGETHGAADVDLASDTFHREFTDEIPLVDGVKDLPNMPGSGRVRDIWEAASQSSALFDILTDFSNATTRAEQLILIDTLLLRWANTAGMQSMEERAEAIDHRFGWWRIGEMTYPGGGTVWAAYSGGGGGSSASVAVMPVISPVRNCGNNAEPNGMISSPARTICSPCSRHSMAGISLQCQRTRFREHAQELHWSRTPAAAVVVAVHMSPTGNHHRYCASTTRCPERELRGVTRVRLQRARATDAI